MPKLGIPFAKQPSNCAKMARSRIRIRRNHAIQMGVILQLGTRAPHQHRRPFYRFRAFRRGVPMQPAARGAFCASAAQRPWRNYRRICYQQGCFRRSFAGGGAGCSDGGFSQHLWRDDAGDRAVDPTPLPVATAALDLTVRRCPITCLSGGNPPDGARVTDAACRKRRGSGSIVLPQERFNGSCGLVARGRRI